MSSENRQQTDTAKWLSAAAMPLQAGSTEACVGSAAVAGDTEVSANYAAILLKFVRSNGFDSEAIVAQSAIAPTLLDNPNAKISGEQYARLITAVLAATDDADFGLRYGQRLNISTHGLLGYAVMSSPSLEKSAELAMKYIKIRNQLIDIQFKAGRAHSDEMAIAFAVGFHQPQLYRFEIDTSISSLFSIWQELLGDSEDITEVHFSYPKPSDSQLYEVIFNSVPVLFGQADNAMFFKANAFARMSRVTDPTLSKIAEQQCENLLAEHQATQPAAELESRVRHFLLKSPGQFLNQEQMAQQMNMTARTLSRQLKAQDTSFRQVLDSVRQDLAQQCLRDTQWNIEDIAAMLNYSDAANFTRAFKRWLGQTPKQYRQALIDL